MAVIKSICVYCGSSFGASPRYAVIADELGREMGRRGMRLVYGGGRVGLMGKVADAVLKAGGQVTGIIPKHLEDAEVGHQGLTELKIVDSMHTRKRMMFDQSDAFVILPGGAGTLDETFEIITWRQLKLHDKPVVILNVDGYWDKLIGLFDHVIDNGFARPSVRQLFSVVNGVGRLFDLLAQQPETADTDYPERM
ncbi:TIGR00730 family Rossman fold protein [Dongia soli]|uniref:Cytokinin riboside 5'-monophosphate phosphoribohydrolase n=1 Tax=Dongia soli TaxID=600628 RepID=A0ABU5EAY6_9PROT|nr:TIGR00730 family Rossman fold protein [Dongia soli]MDY0882693.1 TIGR00730 family Rossman fold protein [Dongia soli]